MQRRSFLTASVVTLGAFAFANRSLALPPDHPYMKDLGLQLYTVRNQLAEDAKGTIEAIAKLGYRQVELMDIMTGDAQIELARDNGMNVTSAFFDWRVVVTPGKDDVAKIEDIIDKAQSHQLKHLVFGYIGKGHRESLDDFRKIADTVNTISEKTKEAGIKLNYHNHSFEFKPLAGDKMGYEIFIERFDPELVGFEFDVFWAAIGGWSPVEILRRLGKRTSQLHLKDLRPGTGTMFDEGQVPATAFQEVGDGSIVFRELITLATELEVSQCHVEQDQSPSPLESIGQSYNYLKDLEPA